MVVSQVSPRHHLFLNADLAEHKLDYPCRLLLHNKHDAVKTKVYSV
jgi:hypothetical protein